MTAESEGRVRLTDARVLDLLRTVAAEGTGRVGYEDRPDSPFAPFWDDRGDETDTFNLAIDDGWLLHGHDSDSDSSSVRLSIAGRRALENSHDE